VQKFTAVGKTSSASGSNVVAHSQFDLFKAASFERVATHFDAKFGGHKLVKPVLVIRFCEYFSHVLQRHSFYEQLQYIWVCKQP
jgi:hypothetical protein